MGRFINADAFTSTGQDILGNNMFAYCSNNPVNRKDDGGKSWIAVLGAIGIQYVADILANISQGKSGWDVFVPISGLATYTAAAVTALIPGSSVVSALVRSVVSEAIEWVDNELNGNSEKNDFAQSAQNVVKNTAVDYAFGVLMDATFGTMGNKEYSDYVPDMVKKGKVNTLNQAYNALQRSNVIGRGIGNISTKMYEIALCYFDP